MSLREIGMNKRHLQKIILFFALLVLAVAGCSDNWKKPKVVINEICSCNFSAGRDENGRYSDCVELYNPGKADISLNGCFLTDDEKDPQKYSLEGLMVPAGGFILVWLDQNAGLPMKELSAAERQNNLKKAFKMRYNDVELNIIIIVDDIYTTGSTIDAVCREFKKAGVERIYFISLAIGSGV